MDEFTKFGNPFGYHPDMKKIPGVDFSSGSLGHGLSIAAGNSILLEEESTDADDDMVTREWRYWAPGATWPQVISTNSLDTYSLPPGEHHLSLYVEDSRGGWDEIHVNITIQSSLPKLDANTFIITPASLTA